MNTLTNIVRKAVRATGFDMVHYAPWQNLFEQFAIDMIFDVGANSGQTYESFRWAGFKGPICSFEPNPDMFQLLQRQSGFAWQRLPYALSNLSGQVEFHITDNDNTSSFQVPLGHAHIVKDITVSAFRLDELWDKQHFSCKNAFLKIDTEGHDLEVIKGASGVLDRIPLIMAEVSPLPRFQGEPLLPDVVNYMGQLGYCVCRINQNGMNRAAGIYAVLDIIFAKRELLEKIKP